MFSPRKLVTWDKNNIMVIKWIIFRVHGFIYVWKTFKKRVIGAISGVNFLVSCLSIIVIVIGIAQLYGHSLIMFPSIQGKQAEINGS